MKTTKEIESTIIEKGKKAEEECSANHPNGDWEDTYEMGEIAAYNDCLSLLEEVQDREKPMKPKQEEYDLYGKKYRCPKCGAIINYVSPFPETEGIAYCQHCGQHLDWESGGEIHKPTDEEKEDLSLEEKK